MNDFSATELPVEAKAILSYWREAKGEAVMPSREWLAPTKLRRWIGDISIVHLHDEPKRFYVALHGGGVARHFGPDFNKKYLEDSVPSGSLSESLAPYLACLSRPVPMYAVELPSRENGLHSTLARLVMPFCQEGDDQIECFLIWVAPTDHSGALRDAVTGSTLVPEGQEEPFRLYSLEHDEPAPIPYDLCA